MSYATLTGIDHTRDRPLEISIGHDVSESVELQVPRKDTELRRNPPCVGKHHNRQSIHSPTRKRKVDKGAPMDVGMAAKNVIESSREEGEQRILDIALNAI